MSLFAATLPALDSRILTDKYRPQTVAGFIGLQDVKDVCEDLIADPRASSYLFVGPSGVGKTTLALALAADLRAQVHHIPSQSCNLDAINRVRHACSYAPAGDCTMHLVLVDEADQMSNAAQIALLSLLDGTGKLSDTVWVFTANATEQLEKRFRSRSMELKFSKEGIAADAAALLADIWAAEAPAGAKAPNFRTIVKDATNNVRESLVDLQRELAIARTRARRAA